MAGVAARALSVVIAVNPLYRRSAPAASAGLPASLDPLVRTHDAPVHGWSALASGSWVRRDHLGATRHPPSSRGVGPSGRAEQDRLLVGRRLGRARRQRLPGPTGLGGPESARPRRPGGLMSSRAWGGQPAGIAERVEGRHPLRPVEQGPDIAAGTGEHDPSYKSGLRSEGRVCLCATARPGHSEGAVDQELVRPACIGSPGRSGHGLCCREAHQRAAEGASPGCGRSRRAGEAQDVQDRRLTVDSEATAIGAPALLAGPNSSSTSPPSSATCTAF